MKAIGKIAQLPAKTREALNRRLHDGQPASVVLPWLNALPEVTSLLAERFNSEPVSEQNLSLWRNGGFQRWLEQSAEIEQTKHLAEFSVELAEAAGLGISKASVALAAGRILSRLQSAGDETELDELLGLSRAAKELHSADVAAATLDLNERKAGQKDKELDLQERQYQLRFLDAFITHANNKRAHDIATGTATKEVKMEQLRLLLFGAAPAVNPVPPVN